MRSTFLRHLVREEYFELKLTSTHTKTKRERKTAMATERGTYCDYLPEHENMKIM
jgi:hypothetical protein